MQLKIVANIMKKEYNMSRLEKEIKRLKSRPKDFTYDEMKKILNNLGFYENNKGKTSGSRVAFVKCDNLEQKIVLHKPHPSNILKEYQIKNVLELLKEWRYCNE